jgi:hypothetical protein
MVLEILWTTKERTDDSIMETIHMSRVHDSLKCYRNVTKQINPSQVDNLITNKSVAILEAPGRIMNIQCDKISGLAYVKNF